MEGRLCLRGSVPPRHAQLSHPQYNLAKPTPAWTGQKIFFSLSPRDNAINSLDFHQIGSTCCQIKEMATGSDFEVSDDADPIVASYDVFIKPQLKDSKKVYILQFPNRDLKQDYNTANSSLPVEFRIKDKARLVELDVPIDTHRNYDREKGVKWGEAVHRSDQSKGGEGGSHGLAGGFGIGAAAHGARPRAGVSNHEEEEVMQELLMRDFGRSVAEGKVLAKQTLGGQAIPKDSTTPQYMIGVFRNGKYFS